MKIRTKFTARDKRTIDHRVTASDGARYYVMVDGSRRRQDRKPWNGKSERRQVIKARREDRGAAAANLNAN